MFKVVRKRTGVLNLSDGTLSATLDDGFEEISREQIQFEVEKFPKNFEDAMRELGLSNNRILRVKELTGLPDEKFTVDLTYIV